MARNTFNTLRDTFSDIAKRKTEAALARRKGVDSTVEHSSVVYAESCAKIASSFASQGFNYAKSGPHMTKRTNGLTLKISFQTSYHNIPGQHVSLSVAANVCSKKLKGWRNAQEHARRRDDWVAGGLIHRLGTDLTYISWELADPSDRDKTIQDVVGCIESTAIPYFRRFEDPTSLIELLQSSSLPAMDIADSVEFALCYGTKVAAEQILESYELERSDLAKSIAQSEEVFRKEGFPSSLLTKYADQVAFLRLAYGINRKAPLSLGLKPSHH